MNTKESNGRKRRLWPWITLLVIAMLLGGLRLAMRSDLVLDLIRAEVETRANEQLKGELQIGRLQGDLWSHLNIMDVRLYEPHPSDTNQRQSDAEDTGTAEMANHATGQPAHATGQPVAAIDSIHVSYSLADLLFRRPLSIHSVHVDGVRADLKQDPAGEWNLLTLLEAKKTAAEPEEDPETDPDSSPFLFTVEDFRLNAPEIVINAQELLPGEPLAVRDLELHTRAGLDDKGFFADISRLDLSLHESRLEAPVTLTSQASWDGRRITLDKLIIAGAFSLLDISGSYDTVTTATDAGLALDPLAWQEVAAYLEEYPLRQDLTMRLQVGGSRQDLHTGISMSAPGLENFQLDVHSRILQEPVITALSASFDRLDLGALTANDTLNARTGPMQLAIDGTVPLPQWDRLRIDGSLALHNIRYDAYSLDELAVALQAQNGNARSDITLRKGEEALSLNLEAAQWWTEDVEWMLSYRTDGINPAKWSGLEQLEGAFVSDGTVSGTGRDPYGPGRWLMNIDFQQVKLTGYPAFNGRLLAEVASDSLAFSFDGNAGDARLETTGKYAWSPEMPEYDLEIRLATFNAAEYPGLEQVETEINGLVRVHGAGLDPETMHLNASLLFDDSNINGQVFDTVQMDLALADGTLRVDDALLAGKPARANLSLIQNIFDFRDPDNRLDFDLELLDLQGFANLAGVDTLQALGRLNGNIRPDADGILVFDSGIDLEQVRYDTLRVRKLTGHMTVHLTEEISYNADLDIREPSAGPYSIRDIDLLTEGRITETGPEGQFDFSLNVQNESGLRMRSDYAVSDTIRIHTTELDLTDPAGQYRLKRPFDVTLAEGVVRVDTLTLTSDNESIVSLCLDKTPETPWTGFLDIRNTDLGQLQLVFLEEPFFETVLTGRIDFIADEDVLEVDAFADFNALVYNSVSLDSIHLGFQVADRRLATRSRIWHEGDELLWSEFSLPFDPYRFDNQPQHFFKEEISGHVTVDEIDLSLFEEMLAELGLEGMDGLFSFHTELSGEAGEPELIGELRLQSGSLSGVAMDTLFVSWDYDHARNDIQLLSRVYSLGQLAADVNGTVPLHIDIPNFTFDGPRPDDPLDVSVTTSEFDLAALNDFLDPELLRNLRGRLDADVEISGSLEDPVMEGSIRFSGGEVRLVPNNITLQRMALDVDLEPGIIEIRRLRVQSSGSLTGSGTIALNRFAPDELDLAFSASNFRAFNTRDLDIFTGLNIQLTGSLDEPKLAGRVQWERGAIFLDDFGEREVEEVILEEEEEGLPDGPDFFERLEMELRFSVDRNAFVRNRRDPEVNLALRGELDLLKQPFEEIEVFGDMGVASGHVTTFNKRFRLERGDITFSGDPTNPALNIRTLYEPRQQYETIRIYYLITGTISDPEFEYESEPEMELQDIISYTLFGRPFHALAGWEQTVSGRSDGSMATNIAVDILIDRIETLAADRLGIDVIEIENTRRGGESGTSIKAGKFVSDRLFVAFLQELGGTEAGRQVLVEYLITRNLELIFTASDDFRSGVDLMWRFDY
ncbi:translocation/assembly module TamB [Balneolales bacterium ANBcel1]|nr:translocation/assembly module TamB [Balneolales bacterium ANBcel1]